MASLKDAEQARVSASETLRELGAHAIAIEEAEPEPAPAIDADVEAPPEAEATGGAPPPPKRRHRKRPSYHVVAYFDEEPPPALPESLEVGEGPRKHLVPLKVRHAPTFQIEPAAEDPEARPE
jgi:hypothetical protein